MMPPRRETVLGTEPAQAARQHRGAVEHASAGKLGSCRQAGSRHAVRPSLTRAKPMSVMRSSIQPWLKRLMFVLP